MIYNQQIFQIIKAAFLGKYTEKPISVFTGEFGTGKSTLIQKIVNDNQIKDSYDGILLLDDFSSVQSTFDFLTFLLSSLDRLFVAQFDWEKSEVIKLRYLFYSLTNNEPFDFEQLQEIDESKYDEKSRDVIKQLRGIEAVLYKAWVFDLMQILDPDIAYKCASKDLGNLQHRKRIIIAIDNTDFIQKIAFTFITQLLEFIGKQRIADIEFCEVLEQNNLPLNDVFDIRFIITFRDSSAPVRFNHYLCDYYKFVHLHPKIIQERLDLENLSNEITVEEVFEHTGANPYLFEVLIEAIKNGGSQDDILNYYVSGFNYLVRLHDEKETQFLLITSFMDTINEYALKLFPEFRDDKDFINNIINRDDILETRDNKLRLKNHIKNIVNAGFKIIEPDMYAEYNKKILVYINCKEIIDDFKGKDFDAFRNLAYFKCFNQLYAIDRTFQSDAAKALVIIDRYKDKFEESKYNYKVKEEIRQKVLEYNRVYDGQKFELKLEMIKNVWAEYSSKLRGDNESLDLEIKKITNELRLLEDDNLSLNKKSEENKKAFVNTSVEIDRLTNKYEPLVNVSGDTDNLIFSIIMLLVFIGLLVYTVINNQEFHIILFTSINSLNTIMFVTLLGATFFGYRYFDKVKTKVLNKSEIERLAKQIAKLNEEKQKLSEKTLTFQADLNAVLSKILELKKHIDRINLQIHENLAKLEEPFI